MDLTDGNWTCRSAAFQSRFSALVGESVSLKEFLRKHHFPTHCDDGGMTRKHEITEHWFKPLRLFWTYQREEVKAKILADPRVRRQLAAPSVLSTLPWCKEEKIQGKAGRKCDRLGSRNSLPDIGITVEGRRRDRGAPPSSPSSATNESVTVVSHGPPQLLSPQPQDIFPQVPCLWMFGQSLCGHFRLLIGHGWGSLHENSVRKQTAVDLPKQEFSLWGAAGAVPGHWDLRFVQDLAAGLLMYVLTSRHLGLWEGRRTRPAGVKHLPRPAVDRRAATGDGGQVHSLPQPLISSLSSGLGSLLLPKKQ